MTKDKGAIRYRGWAIRLRAEPAGHRYRAVSQATSGGAVIREMSWGAYSSPVVAMAAALILVEATIDRIERGVTAH